MSTKYRLRAIHLQMVFWVKNSSHTAEDKCNKLTLRFSLDTLVAAKAHGYKLPNDIDDDLLRDLEDVVVKEWFYGNMVSEEVRRLSIGRLMGVIRDRMIYREEGTKEDDAEIKLAVYSGHDT